MILLIATLFLTMMFSSGCKKSFDVTTGTWTMTYSWTGGASGSVTWNFTGDKKTGEILVNNIPFGLYTVDGKNVTIDFLFGTVYSGSSTDDNTMSGTMQNSGATQTGIWNATR